MAFKPTPTRARSATTSSRPPAAPFLTGIYGGYFGAAQGVILLAVLRLAFADDLQRLNAVKNVLAARGQRRRGRPVHRGRRRRLGGRGADRGRLDRRARGPARTTAAGCRRSGCAGS